MQCKSITFSFNSACAAGSLNAARNADDDYGTPLELSFEIDETMQQTRRTLLENFDDEVRDHPLHVAKSRRPVER